MFQWKSIESMKRGDLLATTSDSALNPIIHLALSLSLSLLPPLYGALSTERRERERRTCVMWHVRAREKSKQRVRPLVRARERRRFSPSLHSSVQRGLSWSASDKATIVTLAQSSLLKLFTGGGKKKSLGNSVAIPKFCGKETNIFFMQGGLSWRFNFYSACIKLYID